MCRRGGLQVVVDLVEGRLDGVLQLRHGEACRVGVHCCERVSERAEFGFKTASSSSPPAICSRAALRRSMMASTSWAAANSLGSRFALPSSSSRVSRFCFASISLVCGWLKDSRWDRRPGVDVNVGVVPVRRLCSVRCLLQCKCNRSTLRRECAQHHRLDDGIENCACSCVCDIVGRRRQTLSEGRRRGSGARGSKPRSGGPSCPSGPKRASEPVLGFFSGTAAGRATSTCMAGANSPAVQVTYPAVGRWSTGRLG